MAKSLGKELMDHSKETILLKCSAEWMKLVPSQNNVCRHSFFNLIVQQIFFFINICICSYLFPFDKFL